MADDRIAEALDAAAETYGLTLSGAERDAYRTEITNTEALLDSLEPTEFEGAPAGEVREGDDEYNAFLYRCELSAAATGPLEGMTLAVKDNIAVAGVPMTCGSAAIEFEPSYHATVTERLVDAGAELIGTTNMDEFAYFTTSETCAHGPVTNPKAEGVPGGSSSGSGAAVAAGLVDAALGTDTGGSVRIPASYCGVVGFKPTFRTVPRFGFADLASSLDHIGPLAPDVETAATVLSAINGPDGRDPSTDGMETPEPTDGLDAGPDGLRVGLVEEAQSRADEAVAEAIEAAADELEAAGVTVERVSLPGFDTQPLVNAAVTAAEFTTLAAQAGQDIGVGTGYSEQWRTAVAEMDTEKLGENVRARLVVGRALTASDDSAGYVAAQNTRRQFRTVVEDRLDEYDALVLSTTPTTAPEYGSVETDADLLETIAHTSPFNLTGHPALSVPWSGAEGPSDPVGCQIVTEWFDEATAVAVGEALESRR
ncbi:Asp-tRNA(Asn)/Glu-tRNA(Gln) amidotransferase subunit GatA [Halovenus sp. WSH3]|uniref:Asp-tRNA(Asn)/Glu-tRNA(Gln) amidotransferase subunit GatA n=1 Tax=Halovenus carboxidivorans TaxID=2692199 RepID=A0A6B0T2V1_9EURY|nr:amidase [Halovenus carboxidivorans]MXR52588.1 Asp-tRNA(Asn)/Glu-tRNA(Gln) amidotransferase subunit GatA [Halovenus carboxidivorans]